MKRSILTLLSAVALTAAGPAIAQDKYPSRPIKIMVPYAAGSATDITIPIVTTTPRTNLRPKRCARRAPAKPPMIDATAMITTSRQTTGFILSGVGAALVAGGVVWIFTHRDSTEQRAVTGWLAPGGGGLAVAGAF